MAVNMDLKTQLRDGQIPVPMRYAAYLDRVANKQEHKPGDEHLRFIQTFIDHGAIGLQNLMEVQKKGWTDEATEKHFLRQRHEADNASPMLNVIWFERMKNVLREVDLGLHVIPSTKALRFLDLGCSPGGFSSYVLNKNEGTTGVGISLPTEKGGHEFCLENHHKPRYDLYLSNLTYFQLGSSPIRDSKLVDIPSVVCEHHFDLVLLDGHQLRTQVGALPWDHDRLLISQLILALRSVAEGGTVIVKLPLPHKLISARTLIMLKEISDRVLVWKPRTMHANRGNFYAVAKGIGGRKSIVTVGSNKYTTGIRTKLEFFLRNLQELWVKLTFGGEEGNGRYLNPAEDMNFVATMDEIIARHLDWLVKLGTPLWRVQEIALWRMYSKNQGSRRSV